MILTDSSAAYIGANTNDVDAINFTTTNFRYFHIYPGLVSYNRAISGTTGLVKTGGGTLATGSIFNYTGPTQINDGQLRISSASTLNGVISGSGSFRKEGSFAVTIGGDNTYTGGTFFSLGTITFTSGNAFGTGLFTAITATQIITANNVTLPNNFQINAGATMHFRTSGANTITVAGNIYDSGNLNKTGNGYLDLTAATLTYTGSTTITGGFIRARKTVGASTATATFQSANLSLSVSFDVPPPSGTTDFRFFQGTTTQTYIPTTISLSGVPFGTTATYNSTLSTLSVIVL
jgi:autotransporter-associated beta strand protein